MIINRHNWNSVAMPPGVPTAMTGQPMVPGPMPTTMEQRLDALMKRCREENHTLTYRDLLEVKGAA